MVSHHCTEGSVVVTKTRMKKNYTPDDLETAKQDVEQTRESLKFGKERLHM